MNETTVDNTQESILIDSEYFQSLLADIRNANTSIDLETYIFNEDKIGHKIKDALINAAIRGVKIRVLVDGAGTPTWGSDLTIQLEQAGISTRIYHPFPWMIGQWHRAYPPLNFMAKLLHLLSHINSRNHRKTVIIDKKIVYVGSANIANCHSNIDQGGDNWHDIMVRLTGTDISNLQYAFNRAWGHLQVKERFRQSLHVTISDPVFRLNYGFRQRRLLYKYLLLRIKQCTKRIWVTNSYFVPDNILLTHLKNAAKRGVDVRIMLPNKTDVFVISLVSNTFYTQLLQSGVAIFEYLPNVLHAKMLILDDWYCVGSSNLNYRSLRHDLEVDVNLRTSAAQKILEQQFLSDLEQSKQINIEDVYKQPLYKRIIGRLLLYARYWL